MICAVAGMTADANILINTARIYAQQYLYMYDDDIPCEQLVKRLCDLKQGYTQTGGFPPFLPCIEILMFRSTSIWRLIFICWI